MAALRVVVDVDPELPRTGIELLDEAAMRVIERVGHRRIDRADFRHRRGGHRLLVAVVRTDHRHVMVQRGSVQPAGALTGLQRAAPPPGRRTT